MHTIAIIHPNFVVELQYAEMYWPIGIGPLGFELDFSIQDNSLECVNGRLGPPTVVIGFRKRLRNKKFRHMSNSKILQLSKQEKKRLLKVIPRRTRIKML